MSEKSVKVRVRKPASAIPVIHDYPTFWTLIAREKNRSNRNMRGFTLVAFNLSNGSGSMNHNDSLLHVVAEEIRSVDIVGWLNAEWIGILLPATSRKGGEQFAQRIGARDTLRAQHKCVIHAFPEKWHLESDARPPTTQATEIAVPKHTGLFLWIVLSVFVAVGISSCGNITETSVAPDSGVTVAFGTIPAAAQHLLLTPSDVSIPRGQNLSVTVATSVASAPSVWSWYVNHDLDPTQTSSTFNKDTTDWQPGQYVLSATIVFTGVKLSGSVRITVTGDGGA